jgi:hypothetical protein
VKRRDRDRIERRGVRERKKEEREREGETE